MIQMNSSNTTRKAGRAPLLSLAFAALCVFSVMIAGCPKNAPAAKVTHVGVLLPPKPPAAATESAPPEIRMASFDEAAENPLPVVFDIPPDKPAAPHHTAPPPEAETVKPPVTPQITPQISPQDQVRAQGDTNADLQTARQNLNSVSGRRMNATQQDMADKIRGFMQQARD